MWKKGRRLSNDKAGKRKSALVSMSVPLSPTTTTTSNRRASAPSVATHKTTSPSSVHPVFHPSSSSSSSTMGSSPATPKRSSFPELQVHNSYNTPTKQKMSPSTSFDTQDTTAISFAGSSVLHSPPHSHAHENHITISTLPPDDDDDESMSSSGSMEASDFHQDLQQLGRAIESLSSRNLQYSPPPAAEEEAVADAVEEQQQEEEDDALAQAGEAKVEDSTSPDRFVETALPVSDITDEEHEETADKPDEMVTPFASDNNNDQSAAPQALVEDAVPIRMDDLDTDVGELQKLFGALPLQDEAITQEEQQPAPITPSSSRDDYYDHLGWTVAGSFASEETTGDAAERNDNQEQPERKSKPQPEIPANNEPDLLGDHNQDWNNAVGHKQAAEATKAEAKEPDFLVDFTDSVPTKAEDPFLFQPDATKPVDSLFVEHNDFEAAPQPQPQPQNPFDDFPHPPPPTTHTTDSDGFPVGLAAHSNHHHDLFAPQENEPPPQNPFDVAHPMDNGLPGFPVAHHHHNSYHNDDDHSAASHDAQPLADTSEHMERMASFIDVESFC